MKSVTNESRQMPVAPNEAAPSPPAATETAVPESRWRRARKWFRALTIERRILAGFALVFIGILIISLVSYRNTTVLLRNSGQDTRSHELLQLLATVGAAMDTAEQSHRRFLVTGEDAYLQPYKAVLEERRTFVRYMRDLTVDAPEQQDRVDQLDHLIEQQVTAEARATAQREEGGFEAVRKLALEGAAKRELAAIHRVVTDMETHEHRTLRERALQSAAWTRKTITLLGLGALLQLVLLAAVYYLIRHDITERRRVAAELQRRGELLEAANKELEAFSYSVSHDLRAPLRHIDGYAALLKKAVGESLNEKAARYLQTISDAAKQMGQLIDDLLVFSRMGRQEMLQTTVNLDQLIKAILYDLRLDLQGRQISWKIEPLPEVPGDPAMLRQVFINLIANAVKFTATRPVAEITVGIDRRSGSEVVIYVRDNGVGFDMQYAPKLFGVFQRLHRADEFEGTGIGLANVRRIVHRHGGRTWAEGVPDKGATFYVALPMRRPSS